VKVRGRLDNYWTEHLRRNLDGVIREGAHGVRLNMSEISFLSSAGVGLLVAFHKKLKAIGGSFAVTSPSDRVKEVLDLCKLSAILLSAGKPAAAPAQKIELRCYSTPAASYEVMDLASKKPLVCHRIGDPELLKGCRFAPSDCRKIAFPEATFGFGLGAFGDGFEDSRTRFGEFLAVDGSAAYLPTDGTNVPDFMVSSGDLVPEMNVLYALRWEGGFSHLVRFETSGAENPLALAELARTALEISGAPVIGMVIVAESAGLVGAALRRSPAAAAGTEHAPFQYPEVRSWLSFSTERLYSRSLALISGVAAGTACAPLASLLRPMGAAAWPVGHFHAAAFSYCPLKKGSIDLKDSVMTLFETETLQGVLHLLNDHREAAGAQQSEFVRGACWIGAASEIR